MNGEPFWRALTPVEIAVLAAGSVALVGMILALLTPRDARRLRCWGCGWRMRW